MRNTSFKAGKLSGTVHDFEMAGDLLPMHEHDERTNHVTVVARGSFRVHGQNWERILTAGDFVDFEPYDPHEFIALEPRSRLVNILK